MINFCKILKGEQLFSALYSKCAAKMNDLKSVLEASARRHLATLVKEINTKNVGKEKQNDRFKRKKRHKQRSNCQEMEPTKKIAHEMHTVPPSRNRVQ
jgi:hypothetical protein